MRDKMRVLSLIFVFAGLIHSRAVHGGVDKTLVSWVLLKDESIRAGSVLTLQNGREFDGIVFGELMEDKWMAGSENWNRSEKNQKEYPNWDSEPGTYVQMAIVYQKDLISIFQDGKPYASYPAKNIDLLSPENNFAVFGKRHVLSLIHI